MAGLTCLALAFPDTVLAQIWHLNPEAREALMPMRPWSTALMGAVAVACGLSAIGLWRLTRWGHRFAIAVLAINMCGDLGNAVVRGDRRTLIGVPIAVAMMAYLMKPSIRRRFLSST